MQLTAEAEELEVTNGELLAQIGNVDTVIARRVLRKHKGDMEKAVDALLAGDRGEAPTWESQHRTTPEPMYSDGSTAAAPHPSSSVIDITGEGEEDLSRAIQMSIQDSSSVTQFKPTDRAPHPEWQMVRSNEPAPTVAHDRTLDDAIQASLQDLNKDEDESEPLPASLREGGRPIAVRHSSAAFAYAALVLQALYHVPQVRSTVSTIRLPHIDPDSPVDSPDRAMWNLIELFTNMDLAQLSFLVDADLTPSLGVPPFDGTKPLTTVSSSAVQTVNTLVEQHMKAQAAEGEEPDRLFSFTHGRISLGPTSTVAARLDHRSDSSAVVMVDIGGNNPYNELVSAMEYILTETNKDMITYNVILTPSDMIAFQLMRLSSSSKTSPDPFTYPKTIYLDRFLFHNVVLTNEKRVVERKMTQDIQEMIKQRENLTRFNGRDTLSDLRSTIHYYEQVADKGDETRQTALERTATRLKSILAMITSKVEDIDHRIERTQAEVSALFDCPELQQFRYDLRVVLMHTGLPGRKQMYSYVQDIEGTWWKTVDHEVTEVPEETVMTDPTGLHLGAGPYMLFYSRHLSDEQLHEPLVWPTIFSEVVEDSNKKFYAAMHPELGIFHSPSSNVASLPTLREVPAPSVGQSIRPAEKESSWTMSVD